MTCEKCGYIPWPGEIEAAQTPRGGWTKETLAEWGIAWPPPKGWKSQLTKGCLNCQEIKDKQWEAAAPKGGK